jgi:hypothetical protein
MPIVIGFNGDDFADVPKSLSDQVITHTVTAGPGETVALDDNGTARIVPADQDDTK